MTKKLYVFMLCLFSANLFAESWQLNSVFKDYELVRDR